MITKIESAPVHRSFLVYDLEWIPHAMTFRLGGLFDGDRYRSFRSVDAMLDHMLSRQYRGKWFYAHFGGMADMTFFLTYLAERKFENVQIITSGSSAIVVKVRQGKNVWTFLDSYWLMRDSLRNIAASVGMQKGAEIYCRTCAKLTKDERKDVGFCDRCNEKLVKWYATVPLRELRDYNELDCRILYRAISRFEEEIHELGSQMQVTIASTAMNLFRRVYLKDQISTSEHTSKVARDAYVASRVEVIEKHMTRGHIYDVNSSFPYSMTKALPGDMIVLSRRIPSGGCYLADLTIEVPKMHLPPMPYRHQKTQKIFFPTGTWRSLFSTPDVELLEETGCKIQKCHQVMRFAPMFDLGAYVFDIYGRRRKEKDSFRRLVYKYLLNCLYGKFAERGERNTLVLNPTSLECPHNGTHPGDTCIEELFPGAIVVSEQVEVPHQHVPIAAFVTAYSRRTIYRYMRPCAEVAYTDTDCVITTDLLPTSDKLGSLKHEGSFEKGEFLRAKLYRLDRKIRAKGFSRMTYEKYTKLREGESVEVERMMRVREMMKKGQLKPKEYVSEKRLRIEKMSKRSFFRKTGHSRPWDVTEIRKELG